MVNRYLYFEPSIIRRTIRALLGKRPYEQHINTINDYSAYLIIAVWEYYYTTGDADFVNSISDDLYALYGNRYGCSLCHAWGAGPIALLGNYCVGVEPTDIAYKTFTVKPNPGRYNYFEAVVPVYGGSVSVKYRNGVVEASADVSGGTLIWNGKSAEIPVGETIRFES